MGTFKDVRNILATWEALFVIKTLAYRIPPFQQAMQDRAAS